MIIRYAKKEDFKALVWNKDLEEWNEVIKENLHDSLENNKLYYVAEIDKKIVGQIVADIQREIPYIYALRVQEEFQNQGIGTALVKKTEQELRKHNFKKVKIEVNIDNLEAKRLYERLGYAIKKQITDRWNYNKDGETKTFEEEVYLLEKDL